jgi:hydroxymethylglutaryl-CoA reductase
LSDSRISGLYRLTVAERISELQSRGWLSAENAEKLQQGRHIIACAAADKMIENVIGVFGLPLAIAPNFLVNNRDYIVPMVVEEPSIVAGTSSAAKLARATGGFTVDCPESLLSGQVYVAGVDDIPAAIAALGEAKQDLHEIADTVHPRLLTRGGGVREIEIRSIQLADASKAIVVHVLVDSCDAMGANIVNAICEALAPTIAELCGGDVALRILSNFSDRSIVVARVCYQIDQLKTDEDDAVTVRDAIILASDIARADIYRAATHNKGIMNGIDAVAIATGNDWRAIEAGAHAYAASTGRYLPLTTWSADDDGNLAGEIRIPLKVGIVGGTVGANPAAAAGIEITGVKSARELAEVMAAVGLAQNFAALKALATRGIQHGHMRLQARSVAATAGAPDDLFEEVVRDLIADGDISVSKAREILAGKHKPVSPISGPISEPMGHAAGKIILLGEHAVVYGKHALAVPIADAVRAGIEKTGAGLTVSVEDWGLQQMVDTSSKATGISAIITLILHQLGISDSGYAIRLRSKIPPSMGMGSSASVAVAIIRAFNLLLELGLDDERINAIAFDCEKLAHGTPSGVDNTVATYGESILFRNEDSLQIKTLVLSEPPPLVIACSNESGVTLEQVAGVRQRYDQNRDRYNAVFTEIDEISQSGALLLTQGNYAALGLLMNVCHGLLNAIGVSTPELESMVSMARANGAVGAKLTGSGGGGSVVALCPARTDAVASAFQAAGFRTLVFNDNKGS